MQPKIQRKETICERRKNQFFWKDSKGKNKNKTITKAIAATNPYSTARV